MANKIEGLVASISKSGGLVTDIHSDKLADVPRDETVSIEVGGHKTVGIYDEDHGQPDSTLIAILPAEGFLRVELTGISLCEMLGLKIGERVSIIW